MPNVAHYLLLVLLLLTAAWLATRLVGPASSSRGAGGGVPALDAEYDFDRAWALHQRRRHVAVLLGRPGSSRALPLLEEAARCGLGSQRLLGEHVIPLARVVGSVDGAAGQFDRDFLPADKRVRSRLQSVLVARRRGVTLPPIDVFLLRGNYYVSDGHHRVAAARALGEDHIAARVTELC